MAKKAKIANAELVELRLQVEALDRRLADAMEEIRGLKALNELLQSAIDTQRSDNLGLALENRRLKARYEVVQS